MPIQSTLFETAETCHYCERPAEFLCDFALSINPYRTCDRPLCDEHRVNQGHMHVCCSPRSKSYVESRDFCQAHAKVPEHFAVTYKTPPGVNRR